MKRIKAIRFILVWAVAAILVSCGTTSTVPLTGRKQRLLVSDEQVMSLSNQEYTNYMKSARLSTNAANTAMVKRAGQKLADAVVTYLKNNGLAAEAAGYQWEFNLVHDNAANAFCLPGGKIVVYEGLLPYTQTESALAIVLGHEIAHAVAKHSAERLSKEMKAQYGSQILGAVLSGAGVSSGTTELAQGVFGLGSTMTSLHYSRSNESEADYMGLVFAAMAGYDPSVAVDFWQRMAEGTKSTTPAFMSSHPSDAKRIADIQKWLPEAQKYYKPTATLSQTTMRISGKTTK